MVKRLYCIDRSFTDMNELFDAVRSCVRCFGLSDNQNMVNSTLNVLQAAALSTKEISVLRFVQVIKEAMVTKVPETGKKERDQVSREIGGSLQYIADKVSDLMLKSQMNDTLENNLQNHHFEELRTVAI